MKSEARSQKPEAFWIMLAFLLHIGCGDVTGTNSSSVERGTLVHGDSRNVGQIRANLLRSQATQERVRHQNYKLAMYGRAAANLARSHGFYPSVSTCEDSSECSNDETCVQGEAFSFCTANPSLYTAEQLDTACSLPLPFQSVSSAVLIGDGRLLTALHNVDGHYEKSEHSFDGESHFEDSTQYGISFDGAFRMQGDPADRWGTFLSEPTGVYSHDESNQFQRNISEENPLLANRLFQLGLEDWAVNNDPDERGRWTRNWLRTNWPATFSECPLGLNACTNESGERGFGTSFWQRDVAVLEASIYHEFEEFIAGSTLNKPPLSVTPTELEPFLDFLYQRSGSFLLDKPAVFFNRVPAKPFPAQEPNRDTPIWAGFYQDWLDDRDNYVDARRVPLIARDAVADIDAYHEALGDFEHYLWRTSKVCDEESVREISLRVLPTTIDTYQGGSGGGVFACQDVEGCGVYDGDGNYVIHEEMIGPINTIGLIQSARAVKGVDLEEWGVPTGTGTTTSSFTGVTPLDELSVAWSEFEDIVITHPKDDPTRLQCAVEGSQGCLRWVVETDEREKGENDAGPLGEGPGIGMVFDPNRDDSIVDAAGTRTTLCGWGNDTTQQIEDENCDCDEFSGTCNDGKCLRRDVQLAVGFIGTAKKDADGRRVVADLRPICGPWTGTPYTENWNHLRVNGAIYGFGEHTGNAAKSRPRLHEALVDMSETRGSEVRPPSMKLCPPNYLPNMISMRITQEEVDGTTQSYVTSLDSLRCVRARPTEEKTDELITVRLHDLDWDQAEKTYNLETYDGFTISGSPFRLEQQIGFPNYARKSQLVVQHRSCAPGVIRGLNTTYDSDGRLRNISLECMPTPQP